MLYPTELRAHLDICPRKITAPMPCRQAFSIQNFWATVEPKTQESRGGSRGICEPLFV